MHKYGYINKHNHTSEIKGIIYGAKGMRERKCNDEETKTRYGFGENYFFLYLLLPILEDNLDVHQFWIICFHFHFMRLFSSVKQQISTFYVRIWSSSIA